MKKFKMFVLTEEYPIYRLCDFITVNENETAYNLKSLFIDLWIKKDTLKQLINNKDAIMPKHCIKFEECKHD